MITVLSLTFIFPFATYSTSNVFSKKDIADFYADSTFEKADSLFKNGNLEVAAMEYERVIFFNYDFNLSKQALYKKSLCLKELHKYNQAIECLEKIGISPFDSSLTHNSLHELSLLYYLVEDYNNSLLKLSITNDLYGLSKEEKFIKALNLNELHKFDSAKETLIEIAKEEKNDSLSQEMILNINRLYTKKNISKIKNSKKLFWISFIPGLGIAYAGKPLEGFSNFLINSAALTFGVVAIINGYYISGYFGGGILIEKFYFGGRRRAEYLLQKNNYEIVNNLNKSIINEIPENS